MFYETYLSNPFVKENEFHSMTQENALFPSFEEAKSILPQPFWQGHKAWIDCYWKAWSLAFEHLKNVGEGKGFLANYLDSAFNGNLFMWDSVFSFFFGRYGIRAFNFIHTLNNFYARQHPDGFICRELHGETGKDCYNRHDPSSTGPNVLACAEWESFLFTGDTTRLAAVFPVLTAYHQWLRNYRTWPDHTYWSTGLGCGMDNQPRQDREKIFDDSEERVDHRRACTHGHLSWIDTCCQQVLSARLIHQMAVVLGKEKRIPDMEEEANLLTCLVNDYMWDHGQGFFMDRRRNGSLTGLKTIGAYWALASGMVPKERIERFTSHLKEENAFNRLHPIPSLSADHDAYCAEGEYWRGSVWAPVNYMVLRGLSIVGQHDLARKIAAKHLKQVVRVFEETGTLWENYAPEKSAPGNRAKPDFVGWTGVAPIAVLLEYVFGIRQDPPQSRIVWDVRLLEAHGVESYPLGPKGVVHLKCAKRSRQKDEPKIQVQSTVPLQLDILWKGGKKVKTVKPGGTRKKKA